MSLLFGKKNTKIKKGTNRERQGNEDDDRHSTHPRKGGGVKSFSETGHAKKVIAWGKRFFWGSRRSEEKRHLNGRPLVAGKKS